MQRKSGWVTVLTILCVAELAGSLETTLVFAALPGAMRQFGDPALVAWLVTGYFLVAGASAALCGRLGDLIGRSTVLAAVLLVAGTGSIISAFASDLGWIIAGRSIQGVAGAVLPLCYGIIREHLPAEKLSFGLAAVTAVASLGAAGGFLIGGVIADHWHWQHIFTASAVLAASALLLCLIALPRSRGAASDNKRSDLFGGILFAPAVGLILLAISQSSAAGIALEPAFVFASGLVLLLIWVRHELRHGDPLIDIRLLGKKPVALANLSALLVSMGAFQVMQIFPILIQQPVWTGIGFGLTATMTGLLKLPSNVASALGAVWAGRLARRSGGQGAIMAGTLLSLIAWTGLYFGHHELWLVVLLVCLSSAGVVISLTGTVAVVVQHVPAERTSEATGITMVLRMTFQGIGAQIVAGLFVAGRTAGAAPGGTYLAPGAILASIGYVAVISLLAVASAVWLRGAVRNRVASAPVAPLRSDPS
ncbi:MFS transporter [Sphingobium phenoxybenzoativorans]|uniref:MFS transporter n=1 Tax=Sphingobium phenoxybenzoativorans TaxID=1592790 RepID=UPI000871BB85|nr:MFS transporter [Sphingobium phenoxybenzoativorans]